MSGSYDPAHDVESVATPHHAFDLGVNSIHTADSHGEDGHSESLIGRTLEGRRHEFVLATTAGFVRRTGAGGATVVEVDGRPDRIRTTCGSSLVRLKTEVIDLSCLHRVDPDVAVEQSIGER